jgi:hypothetical protein
MRSQLLLFRTCRQLYELNSERPKPREIRHGEFFSRSGGTHADQFIRMVHAAYQKGEAVSAFAARLKADCPIDTGRPEIIHGVRLIGGQVESTIDTQP